MNVLARSTRAVVATLVFPLLLLAACSHSARPAAVPASVKLAYCGGQPQLRPDVVEVICTTDDITARHLTWSGWGKPFATASGTAVVDLCAFEDCHSGTYSPFPIVVIASKIVSCAKHTRAYSRLQYVFVGSSPFADIPANISFKGFISGAGRPGPPRNQTVSLTC
jgi:hypothetical protein